MTSENVGTLVSLRMAERVWVRMLACRSTDKYEGRYKGWRMMSAVEGFMSSLRTVLSV